MHQRLIPLYHLLQCGSTVYSRTTALKLDFPAQLVTHPSIYVLVGKSGVSSLTSGQFTSQKKPTTINIDRWRRQDKTTADKKRGGNLHYSHQPPGCLNFDLAVPSARLPVELRAVDCWFSMWNYFLFIIYLLFFIYATDLIFPGFRNPIKNRLHLIQDYIFLKRCKKQKREVIPLF